MKGKADSSKKDRTGSRPKAHPRGRAAASTHHQTARAAAPEWKDGEEPGSPTADPAEAQSRLLRTRSRAIDWTLEAPELAGLADEVLNVSGVGVGFDVAGGVEAAIPPFLPASNPYRARVGRYGKKVSLSEDAVLCRHLLANLHLVSTLPELTTLGVHFTSEWYKKEKGRLPAFVSKRRFTRVYGLLLSKQLIVVAVKGSEHGGSTRILPTPDLLYRFSRCGPIMPRQSGRHREEIELRGPARKIKRKASKGRHAGKMITVRIRGDALPFEETEETVRMRRNVRTINEHLQAAKIGWADTPEAHAAWQDMTKANGGKRRIIKLTSVLLHRPFNEEWCYGGRLYGGWWQSVRGKYRKHITINDEPTVELDWEALHLRLCYAIDHHAAPQMDAERQWYELPGVDSRWRPFVKLLTNQMLNCAADEVAIRATMNEQHMDTEPGENGEPSRKALWQQFKADCVRRDTGSKGGTIIKELRRWANLIRERHHAVASWFDDPKTGSLLQNADSSLMEAMLLRAFHRGLVPLPVHDSVLVARTNVDAMRELMNELFNFGAGGGIAGQIGDGIKMK